MGQDPRTESTTVTESSDPEQIREEIEANREELGDTVAAHGHSIESIRNLHGPFLVRDDEDLATRPEFGDQRDQPAKVHVVHHGALGSFAVVHLPAAVADPAASPVPSSPWPGEGPGESIAGAAQGGADPTPSQEGSITGCPVPIPGGEYHGLPSSPPGRGQGWVWRRQVHGKNRTITLSPTFKLNFLAIEPALTASSRKPLEPGTATAAPQ